MAEQVETTGAARPLNKALWMQALDVLEREFVEFQERNSPPNSVHGPYEEHEQ